MINKVYIRVDGNTQIGLGHLVRSMAFAQMLGPNFEISFICKEIPENIINEIENSEFNLAIIKKEEDFFAMLYAEIIVVLDHYGLDSNYQKTIKEKGCKLVCIDDLHDNFFYADLIINHSPSVRINDYNAQDYSEFALGLNYALLRPRFLEEAKKEKKEKNTATVFICFGGSDIKNLTAQTVKMVLEQSDLNIIVVTGASYKHTTDLHLFVKSNTRVQYEHAINADRMVELMKMSGIAIVPASGILLEIIAVGVSPLICYVVDNQKEFHDYLIKNCNFITLGYLGNELSNNAASLLSKLIAGNEKLNNSLTVMRFQISMAKENCATILERIALKK